MSSVYRLYREGRKAFMVALGGFIILFVNELVGTEMPIPVDGDLGHTVLLVVDHLIPYAIQAFLGGGVLGTLTWWTKQEPYTGRITKGL